MKTRLFWVRHGPTHAKGLVGWADLPADLSDTARIARLDAHLPRQALLVSSDLSRAAATADTLAADRTRLPHDPALRELHFGDWDLKAPEDIKDQSRYQAFWDHPGEVRPPSGETWPELAARVDAATDALIATHPGADLVIVAHLGVILTQLQRALALTATEAFSHSIAPLSVTELHHTPTGWHVSGINHVP
ncbi:phosphoglycerate mutase [Roseovarius atlanticus]|uniref:Phosphoglycerate mutase n=1 Tax=Roseovarius atlanticus TaxID=1641875 RepID=A0A0T5NUC1_9RHOB|nr:histidine phosphatase family protein [Roseovarius atlanticus]KRS12539.1 phosphoglycerate mutase [Roseovarius atlanticus]